MISDILLFDQHRPQIIPAPTPSVLTEPSEVTDVVSLPLRYSFFKDFVEFLQADSLSFGHESTVKVVSS